MRNRFEKRNPEQIKCVDKFLFRSLTYFKAYDANFYVPSGLIFAVIYKKSNL